MFLISNMVHLGTINLIAVLAAAVAAMVIGFLWYGPLFGKQWIKLMGLSSKDINKAKQKGMGKLYLINFIAGIVTAYVLAVLVDGMAITSALITGFWVWLGFFAAVMVGSILWEGKPLQLYFLNVIYWLVNVEVMSVILSLWA